MRTYGNKRDTNHSGNWKKSRAVQPVPLLQQAPHHEGVWGRKATAIRINLGQNVVSFTSWPTCPRGKSPCIPCIGGWIVPRAGSYTSKKKRIPLYYHKSNTNSSVVQALGSSLFQLSYSGHWAKPLNYTGMVRTNVTLRRVRVTTVTVQKQQVFQISVCVCSLCDPASKAHAPYCRLLPVWFYHIFPHYLINGTIFGKKLLNKNVCLISYAAFVWNISYPKKNSARIF